MTDHADALRMSTERARERDILQPSAPCEHCGHSDGNSVHDCPPSPDPDTLLRELVREVARQAANEAVSRCSGDLDFYEPIVSRCASEVADEILFRGDDHDTPLARVRERMR